MSKIPNPWIKHVVALAIVAVGVAVAVAIRQKNSDVPKQSAPQSLQPDTTFLFHNDAEKPTARYSGEVDPKLLEESIHLSAQYLVGACDSRGKFAYRVNMDPAVQVKAKYNMLRHAGTIYSLASYYLWRKDEKVKNAVMAALGFLKTEGFERLPGDKNLLAVWSRSELSGDKAPVQSKLGGAALALVAALTVEKMAPGSTSKEDLIGLGGFILHMQKEDGSFYSKFIPEKGGKDDEFQSRYYPGEAAFGLAMLYEADNSPSWLNGAARALAYLASTRQGQTTVEPDHWALLATRALLKNYEASDKTVPRDVLVKHALQIAASIVKNRPKVPDTSPLFGTLGNGGATTPTATRLEGLLAFMEIAREIPDFAPEETLRAIENGLAFVLRAQVRSGKYKGAVPRSIRREPKGDKANNERATEIRIDYNQHAMSAMIQYTEYLRAHSGGAAPVR